MFIKLIFSAFEKVQFFTLTLTLTLLTLLILTLLILTLAAGIDYGPFSAPSLTLPLLLPANDTQTSFFIPITNDAIVENSETFAVALESRDPNVLVVGPQVTIVTIEDDDGERTSKNFFHLILKFYYYICD